MALTHKNRVKETSTTTGTGTYTLAGAVTGYQSFSAIGDTNTCYYVAEDGTNWEVGTGTYTSAGTTLARTAVLASSNAGAAVNWAAGTRNIFVGVPAEKFAGIGEVALLASGNTFTALQTVTQVAIGGATIGASALAVTGSTLLNEAVGSSALTLTGATQTASFPVINATQTWNNAGVTFTGMLLNVTNTASNTASRLLDVQSGGVTQFYSRADGYAASNAGFFDSSNNSIAMVSVSGLQLGSSAGVKWSSTALWYGSIDLSLFRDAANTSAQRNGANAQTLRVYNTYTDAGNYERLEIAAGASGTTIYQNAAGTGAARSLSVGTLVNNSFNITTNGTGRWSVNGSGNLLAQADNTYDIGASGATRPRRIYLSAGVTTAGGAVFLTTSTALTDGAGAGSGTILNAPAAGNPTKWIGINDNGTTRYIPAW